MLPELDAATAATLDTSRVVGVVTTGGGATGHGVIVAKSRGIPIITDVAEAAEGVEPGTTSRVRREVARVRGRPRPGSAGAVRRPDPGADRPACSRPRPRRGSRQSPQTAAGSWYPRTSRRSTMPVKRRARGPRGPAWSAPRCSSAATRPGRPSSEQVETFLAVAAALDGQPITIRTWDVGGDKPLRVPAAAASRPTRSWASAGCGCSAASPPLCTSSCRRSASPRARRRPR